MATFEQIARAFREVLPKDKLKGGFYIESEESYGFTGEGDEAALDEAIAKIENNEPILEQLSELDKVVTRFAEDLVIADGSDEFLVEKAKEKKQLRASLI